ncbi:MAG: hypothetical protein V1672_04340 [Candidatus Diapherotrites archaeon]
MAGPKRPTNKRNLPNAKPRTGLPQYVIDSLNYRHGFHISDKRQIAQTVAGEIAESMDTHKLNAVSKGQLKIHLNELNKWLKMELGDPDSPIEKDMEKEYRKRRDALAKFLKENP